MLSEDLEDDIVNAVEMRGIVKQYPLVRAVDQVDFTLRQGEIVSLLGENGAGKSTLMKILYGMTRPDAGEIRIRGEVKQFKDSKQAIDAGIGMVHQHFMLVPAMSVLENVIAGAEHGKGWLIDYKSAREALKKIIDQFNFHISPDEKVGHLSVGEQQRVEIIKAIYRGAEILILDEPTAVLTPQEAEELFHIMHDLRATGKSIVIITHKLKETFAIADRIAVMRDGRMVQADIPTDKTNAQNLANLMVGREVNLTTVRRATEVKEEIFRVEGLTLTSRGRKVLNNISLHLRRGEVLGIAGIEGNGQTELIEVLTGIRKPDRMSLFLNGALFGGNARAFLSAGIGHVPEDRMVRGLILDMSVEQNLLLGHHTNREYQNRGWFHWKQVRNYSTAIIQDYQIKAPTPQEKVSCLSGGNQQKTVIARVFSHKSDVIIIAQPTRGVDIGASEYIHNMLLNLRDSGKAILLVSADLDEVKQLSDRIHVLYDGKIVKQLLPGEIDDITLGMYMTGSKSDYCVKEEEAE
jgi:simple sugar transport system ATP-binding protein